MNGPSVKGTFGLDNSPLKRGVAEANAIMMSFKSNAQKHFQGAAEGAGVLGKTLSGLGAPAAMATAAIIGIAAGVKKLIDSAGEVQDMSDKWQTTAESIQRVDYVAQQAGTSVDAVGKALANATLKAKEGDESFAKLGISAGKFLQANMEERLVMLAKAYEAANGNAAKQAELLDLLGTRGAAIFPVLAAGASGLTAAMDELPTASSAAIGALDELGDLMDSLMAQAKALTTEILGTGLALFKLGARLTKDGLNPGNYLGDLLADKAKAGLKNIIDGGPGPSEEELEKREKAEKRLFELQERNRKAEREARLESYTHAQKVLDIETEISVLRDLAAQATSEEQRLEFEGQILEKEKEIRQVNKEAQREAEQAADKLESVEKKRLQLAEKEAKEWEKVSEEMDEALAKMKELNKEAHEKNVDEAMKSPDQKRAEGKEQRERARKSAMIKEQQEDKADRDRRARGDTGYRPQLKTPAEKQAEEEKKFKGGKAGVGGELPADAGASAAIPSDNAAADPIQPQPAQPKGADPQSPAGTLERIKEILDQRLPREKAG